MRALVCVGALAACGKPTPHDGPIAAVNPTIDATHAAAAVVHADAKVAPTVDGKRATPGQASAARVDPPHVVEDRAMP